ncbi:hypothetical protein ACFWZ1_10455 [Frateuria sp. GZRe14]|uniref:hypothetical protein n=1 Tax=Frateuria sp. GZRe14 TaxID=3351534 RepID=UPI003EDC4054
MWNAERNLNLALPQGFFDWLEIHPGLSSWVQAIGSILAICVAIWIASRDRRHEASLRREEREEDRRLLEIREKRIARALATVVMVDLHAIQQDIDRLIGQGDISDQAMFHQNVELLLEIPSSLAEMRGRIHELGAAADVVTDLVAEMQMARRELLDWKSMQRTHPESRDIVVDVEKVRRAIPKIEELVTVALNRIGQLF